MKASIFCSAVVFGAALVPTCNAQFQAPPPAQAESAPTIDTAALDQLLQAGNQQVVRFHREDVLSVSVFGLTAFAGQERVEDDGTVRFPFVGTIKVEGMTIAELEVSLESKLKDAGIIQDPQVSVTAVSQPWNVVTVSGDVMKPGVFPAAGNLTLIDFISEAGGLLNNLPGSNLVTNSMASATVTLVRPSVDHPMHIPLGPDAANSPYARIPLMAGDNVRVGRVGLIYAVGAFRFQGAFPLKNNAPTTVVELMAMAGGIGFEGIRSGAHIIRVSGNSQISVDVDIDRILKGRAADVPLQPNDILFVPTNMMKAAIKGGGTGALVSFANGLLISTR